ncbi:hypothetical protein A2U01_0015224, partial [Trifolium medium]|nr:hypothetical protein [Trifolium medium]
REGRGKHRRRYKGVAEARPKNTTKERNFADPLPWSQGEETNSMVPDSQVGLNLEVVLSGSHLTSRSGIDLLLKENYATQQANGTEQEGEATKLFQIQKQVGICYEEGDEEVVKVLVKDELPDRKEKAEWEQKNSHQ